jgi:hypothetical protein
MARKNLYLNADDPTIKRLAHPSPLLPPAPGLPAFGAAAAAPGLRLSPTSPPELTAGGGLFAPGLAGAGLLPAHLLGGLPRPQLFSPVTNLRDNPPCNTLFM